MPPREIYKQGGMPLGGTSGIQTAETQRAQSSILVEIYIIANFASVARTIFQKSQLTIYRVAVQAALQ
jgi:hypothetical protein